MNLETFFTSRTAFPALDNEKIDTLIFLEASSGVAEFFDLLGSMFSPVKKDINGNVDKLRKAHQLQPEAFRHVNDLIVIEAPKKMSSVAIEALLWLKRGLEFLYIFLNAIIEDNAVPPSQNVSGFCMLAYEQTLKPYHGWMVQKLFQVFVRACPYRKDLLKAIALGKDDVEEIVIIQSREMLTLLKQNLDVINGLYEKYDLNDKTVV